MTFTVTPAAKPVVRELTSSAAAALRIAGNALAGGRVGLEVEAHCVDLADPHGRPRRSSEIFGPSCSSRNAPNSRSWGNTPQPVRE